MQRRSSPSPNRSGQPEGGAAHGRHRRPAGPNALPGHGNGLEEAALLASRVCFGADVPLEAQTVSTASIGRLDEASVERIVQALNRHGFSIVACSDRSDLRRDLLLLKALFGDPTPHKRADADGIVPIDASDPIPGHIDSSHEEHPPHTDGAFADDPERILSLQCEVPADTGGLSTLACAKAAFEHLLRTFGHRARLLQRPDALKVTRNDQSSTRPVFSPMGTSGAFAVRFRMSDGAAVVEPHPEVRDLYEALCRFFVDPANRVTFRLKAGQVLLLDNTSVVHGRTAFAPAAPRRLRRLNFDGSGPLCSRLRLGFRPGAGLPDRAGGAGPALAP